MLPQSGKLRDMSLFHGLILISGGPMVDFQLKLMDLAKNMILDIMNLSRSVRCIQTHTSRSKKGFNKAKAGG